jgi:hypothetical protein
MSKAADDMQKIFNNISENPVHYGAYSAVFAMVAFISYDIYKNNESVRDFVSNTSDFVNSMGDAGFNLTGRNISIGMGNKGEFAMHFNGSISDDIVLLTSENKYSFNLSAASKISVEFGFGVNIPRTPNSIIPEFRNTTLNNADRNIIIQFSTKF